MYFYKNELTSIPGVGEKAVEALNRLHIYTPADLLFHFPSQILKKKLYTPIFYINHDDNVILRLRILDIDQPNNIYRSRKKAFNIYCENETGRINLCYFNYFPQYLLNWAKKGEEIIVIGKVDIYNKIKQIAHPEVLNPLNQNIKISPTEVIYPLTYGIVNKQLQKFIKWSLEGLSQLEEWIDASVLIENDWPSFYNALKKIHYSEDMNQVLPYSKERQRIAYDELLATQLMVNMLRQYKESHSGRSVIGTEEIYQQFLLNLPFELTQAQKQAINDIFTDQKKKRRMSRLVQGDVGSGKTVVSFAAMINAAEAKIQSVLMAPTDVLATQHYLSFDKYCKDLPLKYALLTGKTKLKERKKIFEGLISGELDILIGTHAVFQEKVAFKDLGLVVIDEQHRFGVNQRMALVSKGNEADLLIMSATPIPRSLSLALYGDMDVTRITEKPKNRIKIKTSVLSQAKVDEIILSLERVLNEEGKIYWVCPLVNENEDQPESELNKTSVEKRMQILSEKFPGMVGIVHGQLDANNKQEAIKKFIEGEYKILVATTVIEVGVDVPDATVIIIENAETFGLSQLHQLRGRVGRGDKPSHCILLFKPPISNVTWQRLKIMKESEDGFLLAEEDLKIRGSGDIIGTKQSGMPSFKTVDFLIHHNLIAAANAQAKRILSQDSQLKMPINRKYHDLINLFGFSKNLSDMMHLS